jgi:hypothetical protein
MAKTLAEAYFDHYEEYLGQVVDRIVFDDPRLGRKIQVLVYSKVFPGCVTFVTLGLCHFPDEKRRHAELVCVVDAVEEEIPQLMFNTAKTLVVDKMELGWGTGLKGVEKVSARFAEVTSKNCVYLANPLPFPEGFADLSKECANVPPPRVYLMLLISREEYDYFSKHGAIEFENYLERERIDPFDVMRVTKDEL